MQPIRERGDIMKLENLIDALDLWKGCLAKFDKKSWLVREIVMWYLSDATNSVIILVDW